MIKTRIVLMAMLPGLSTYAQVSQNDLRNQEWARKQSSPLHQQTIAAGGKLSKSRIPDSSKLYSSIETLMQASEQVLVAHVLRNSCQLSPDGTSPITVYEAAVIQAIKGPAPQKPIFFATPTGAVAFEQGARAFFTCKNFTPLVNGGRYVLFLRGAHGPETGLTPGLRLAGDAVQGAFLLKDDNTLEPCFGGDTISRKLWNNPIDGFLRELQSIAAAQKKH